jgi:putative ABC transport system permease protein
MKNTVWLFLASKEMWRNRGRFFLVSLVIALITLLVIFLAGLAEGLGSGNTEFLSKLEGELVLYQEQANLSASASQIGRSSMNNIRRVEGVADAGAIGVSSVYITYDGALENESVSLLGVEPGRPGEPEVLEGRALGRERAEEAVIGRNVALRTGLGLGDTLVVKSTQGTVEELYNLEIVGIAGGQQYFLQPSVFVPLLTWDRIRPKAFTGNSGGELAFNIVNVKVVDPAAETEVAGRIEDEVRRITAVDRQTAWEAAPGYSEQQSTLNTQRGFTLLIGILVVGGFFQIQTLQKVGQVGMLKALGSPNWVVSLTTTSQIVLTNFIGVVLGGVAALLLALTLPSTIPIVFEGQQVMVAIVTLLLIGPLGGLVSIRYLTKVEPLTALGLAG